MACPYFGAEEYSKAIVVGTSQNSLMVLGKK